jgi:DNA-binding transcriptional MerR regulator
MRTSACWRWEWQGIMAKATEAFRTISEVSDDLRIPKHVLRFWEAKFSQLKPMKRGGGRRYYRPEDLELLAGIHHLLHSAGYTIRGVQKILREQGVDAVKAFASRFGGPDVTPAKPNKLAQIDAIIAELQACLKLASPPRPLVKRATLPRDT